LSSLERKLSRNKTNKKKKDLNKEISTKVGLFDKLPEKCLTCGQPYDKLDKDMVKSWYVIVKEQEKSVHLYCPECWKLAINILEEFEQHLEHKNTYNDCENE